MVVVEPRVRRGTQVADNHQATHVREAIPSEHLDVLRVTTGMGPRVLEARLSTLSRKERDELNGVLTRLHYAEGSNQEIAEDMKRLFIMVLDPDGLRRRD